MEYISLGLTIKADITDATQYATVYTNTVVSGIAPNMPVATLQRARVLDKTYAWKLFDRDGNCLYTWRFAPKSYQSLVDTAARVLTTNRFYA